MWQAGIIVDGRTAMNRQRADNGEMSRDRRDSDGGLYGKTLAHRLYLPGDLAPHG